MMEDGYPCLVQGCDFVAAPDDDWHERLEQHVRWIHIPEREFGMVPVGALFALLLHGLIKPDEFAVFTRDVIEREMNVVGPPRLELVQRGWRYVKFGYAFFLVALGLIVAALWLPHTWYTVCLLLPAEVALAGLFSVMVRVYRLSVSHEVTHDIRVELYPDTGEG